MIRSMIKRLNKALPALLLGIVLYGLLVQFIGVWFVKDKLLYSTGLWIGIAMAMGMAIHIAVVIEDAIALNGEKQDCRMVPSKIYDSSDHIFCHVKIPLRKCTNGICRSYGIKGSGLSAAFYS